MEFGSKEWQEYYHGRNVSGHRPKGDLAQRANKALRYSLTKRGQAEYDDMRCAEHAGFEAFEASLDSLAVESANEELQSEALESNLDNANAITVKVWAPQGLPETIATTLLQAGFRWSLRRGGMFWAPRNPETLRIVSAILS